MIPRIPKSNPLRFVHVDNYEQDIYNHDNRLSVDSGRAFDDPNVYFRKFDYADNIPIQFSCDYINDVNNPITVELFNLGDELVRTITLTKTVISTNWFRYDASIDTSLLLGYYYVKLVFSGKGKPTYTYKSDPIMIDDYDSYTLVKFREKEGDGIVWDDNLYFNLRIEADITDYDVQEDVDQFKMYSGTVVNAGSTLYRATEFITDPIPKSVCEWLDIAFSHDVLYINGIKQVASTDKEIDKVDGTILRIYTRQFLEAEYENYAVEIEGSQSVEPGTDTYSPDGTNTYSPDSINEYAPY